MARKTAATQSAPLRRQRLDLTGTVQGVGLRPFVQRLAEQFGLSGWVANRGDGVTVEVQGDSDALARFIDALRQSPPATARIAGITSADLTPQHSGGFSIAPSVGDTPSAVMLPPDLAPCADCLREFHDPRSRRYHYPFISCTGCGPRWSLLRRLPFDREHTAFADFPPCSDCIDEYNDIHKWRHHHQAISCPQCGPALCLVDGKGQTLAAGPTTLSAAADRLRAGQIVALKSVGGFQLLADAGNPRAIARLRRRKQRPAKPLAVMFTGLGQLQQYCHTDAVERQTLLSPIRPIVLLKGTGRLPEQIAPAIDSVGALLPPSALHEALCVAFPAPLVATSGNISGEPLCFDNAEALQGLQNIADVFLMHDLAIARPLDDSVIRIINHRPVTLRAGRGLAPYLLGVEQTVNHALLAVGGHQKNTIAINTPQGILAGAHIGGLDSLPSLQRLSDAVEGCRPFARADFTAVITDLHPDYGSSRWAADTGYPTQPVQHHIAHFFGALAEHCYRGPALGVCWDGIGLGDDGTLWGGEFFTWDGAQRVERVARLRRFPLPGGEAAIREPRRQALGLLTAVGAPVPEHVRAAFSDSEWRNLHVMLEKQLNSPLCSSAGRLIDVISALLRCCYRQRFEADAAMRLEMLAHGIDASKTSLPFSINQGDGIRVLDWQPLIEQLLEQQSRQAPGFLAAAVFNSLAAMIATIAAEFDKLPVFLSGGVFQNRYLTEATIALLHHRGHRVFTHAAVPPNDGGLAVGQLYYAMQTAGKPLCV